MALCELPIRSHEPPFSSFAKSQIAPLPPNDVLLSLRVGKVRPLGAAKIRSAINKEHQNGRIQLNKLGFTGDEQAFELHGGVDKAVHQYCSSHYKIWNAEAPGREHLFTIGGFGENISTAYMNEDNVCVGDTFRLGADAIIQVSQPRQPCYKLNHRFQYKKTSSLAQSTGRTGWYYRVVKPGLVGPNDTLELIERINPSWPLSRVQNILYHDTDNRDALMELVQLPGLADELIGVFSNRLTGGVENMDGRLDGIPMEWRSFKLIEKTTLTPRVKRFVFAAVDKPADGEDISLPHISHVRIKFGPKYCYTRAYSVVTGDMQRLELGIAKADDSRGGSKFLHDEAQIGDVFEVSKGKELATSQDCTEGQTARRHIFIIGGIGVTAFLSKIRDLSKTSEPFEVHYAMRDRKDAAYLDQLPVEHTTCYSKTEGRRLDLNNVIFPGETDDFVYPKIYCCGPTSLLKAVQDLTEKLKYPRSCLHFESFVAESGPREPFEVEIKSTGQVMPVPAEKTLLDVLNEAGFGIESSCLVGNCGTCMVDLVKGDVDHRGTALDEEQKQQSILTCVSRGRGCVTVDCE